MTRLLLLALTFSTIVLIILMVIKGDFPEARPSIDDHPELSDDTQTTTVLSPLDVVDDPDTATTGSTTISLLTPRDYDPTITPSSDHAQSAMMKVRPRLIREFSQAGLHFGSPIFIRIFKASRELEIWAQPADDEPFQHFKTYTIAAYSGQLGPKMAEGDRQAPEGFYYVPPRALNPNSRFHLSFNLGFPNRYDRVHQRTGSALMVHGSNVSIGCYAMTDERMEEIYTIADAALGAGQPFFRVHVFPFKMTEKEMRLYESSPHYEFWKNLKEGYDAFEKTRTPPNVRTVNKRYQFSAT